ncbi:aspartyl/glutamyl-tRNA(Asn/Gln) amidotransferase subunit C [candidate division KSB1 bacterium 4484_219]|nr:MAG: aspartyl/glutamyl-tRNA(Asn/Gln) amidotransferase subunit C [candidate division KSB1 bacterium 4484_219]
MKEEITLETFNHLVELAALELSKEEAEYIRKELNNQLTSIHQLQAIQIDDSILPTSHGIPYTSEMSPPIREDKFIPFEEPDNILSQAPELEDRYIVVPDIPHTDLE